MPTLSVKREILFGMLDQSFTDDEFNVLCFDFGLELEEVTNETQIELKGKGSYDGFNETPEDVIYKIDIPANRYDLLCLEGLSVALLVFQNKMPYPHYKAVSPINPKNLQQLIIKENTNLIRPYALCAVLRNITLTTDSYTSFLDLQEKLHNNLARKRSLVAIGTHDLDTIQGPFIYDALPPDQIKFCPLNQDKEFTAIELMDLYSTHTQLKQYLPIIRNSTVYPVIKDANGVVLSMPPIINGNHSKITLNTKNIFIEVTATNLHKAHIVLETLVTAFSQHCKEQYTCEVCEIILPDESTQRTPRLSYRKETINTKELNNYIGINESGGKVAKLLSRMCLAGKFIGGSDVLVKIPPTRHDVIHPVDIYEDAAIAYGFNNIPKLLPTTSTIGQQLPINKLSDQLREQIAQSGYTEGLTFALCSRDDLSVKLRKSTEAMKAIHISNPKTLEFQVGRTTLLPGLLKTIANNKSMPLPLKLFEVSDIIFLDSATDTGARNERHICAVHYDKKAGFEKLHGLLDRIMQLLEVPWSQENGYFLKGTEDETYFPNRCAEIIYKGQKIGQLGILHPHVIKKFELSLPCSVLEINIEPFV